MKPHTYSRQGGGTLLGLVIGMVLGLAIALFVAVYISRSSFPIVKLKPKTGEPPVVIGQLPDLNAPLYGNLEPARAAAREVAENLKNRPPAPATAPVDPAAAANIDQAPAANDPKIADKSQQDGQPLANQVPRQAAPQDRTVVALPAAPAASVSEDKPAQQVFFVQAGAYHLRSDAEAIRTRLAMAGIVSLVSEHQSENGTMLYRVRIGPLASDDAVHESVRQVTTAGLEATIVRSHK